ncbi:MAG: CASTOR/POLLUX-related putative ion channel, partial [Chloroflexota bacterium]
AQALVEVGGKGLLTVNPLGTVAGITARVLRTSGLGAVYEDILDFRGDEIYTTDIPAGYVNRPFRDLLLSSTASSIIGLLRNEEVMAAPPFDTMIEQGDRAIAISADDSSLTLDREPQSAPDQNATVAIPRSIERTLVIGWSRLGSRICLDNEAHVLDGSELTLLVDPDLHDVRAVERELALQHQRVLIELGNPVHRSRIDAVLAAGPYHHILVLAEREKLSHQEADARALLALLHIRRWLDENIGDAPRPNLVGELLDVNDEIIGQVAKPDDFIVSERLVSLALTQLSENPAIYPILRQLLNAEGMHLFLVDQGALPLHDAATFYDVVVAAQRAGAIAIGIQRVQIASDGTSEAVVLLNPNKYDRLDLSPEDRVVALMRVGSM